MRLIGLRLIQLMAWFAVVATPLTVAARPSMTEARVFALGRKAQLGDSAAVAKLFHLRADGAVAEDVDVALGAIIRRHPRLFLAGLKDNWRVHCPPCLLGLVGNTGDGLAERYRGQLAELQARRAALQAVRGADLADLKAQCLKALDADIAEVRRASNDPEARNW